jgi:hypothetical protein
VILGAFDQRIAQKNYAVAFVQFKRDCAMVTPDGQQANES